MEHTEDFDAEKSGSEEDEDLSLSDQNTCTLYELEQQFGNKYKLSDESSVTLKRDYILSLCTDSGFTRIVAGISNASVKLFDVTGQSLIQCPVDNIPTSSLSLNNEIKDLPNISVCGVKFLDESPNLLLVGTTNGLIHIFDLRVGSKKGQTCFGHNSQNSLDCHINENIPKNIVCFDRNANGRVLCTGTEQHLSNVFLYFYDVRESKLMGSYFESHQDDITNVCFHPDNPDLLCSGSTDGLINIFDIKQNTEDDALQTSVNTESSVYKINWHKSIYGKDFISCITHTNDLKTYEEDGDLITEFTRCEITGALKRKNASNCNLVNVHNMDDGNIFLLGGTNFLKGDVLRSVRIQNKQLLPHAVFDGNKQIIRDSVYDSKTKALITGGESSIVSLWTPQDSCISTMKTNGPPSKSKTKKRNTMTPY